MKGGQCSFLLFCLFLFNFSCFHYFLLLRPHYLSSLGNFHMINESGVSSGGEIDWWKYPICITSSFRMFRGAFLNYSFHFGMYGAFMICNNVVILYLKLFNGLYKWRRIYSRVREREKGGENAQPWDWDFWLYLCLVGGGRKDERRIWALVRVTGCRDLQRRHHRRESIPTSRRCLPIRPLHTHSSSWLRLISRHRQRRRSRINYILRTLDCRHPINPSNNQ